MSSGGKKQPAGAYTGSLGPRAALQPPAPPAAEGTRRFLPSRPRPGPSQPGLRWLGLPRLEVMGGRLGWRL